MFNLWLDQPNPVVIAVLAAGLALTAVVLHWISFRPRHRPAVTLMFGVVPTFFTSISILFSLYTGFLASDVWERQRQAARTVLQERDSLLAINALSTASAMDREPVRLALRTYVEAVVEDEWPRMADQEQSALAELALGALLSEAASPRTVAGAGQVAQTALLDAVLRLRAARTERLTVSGANYDAEKWATVLALAVLTQVGLALVHLNQPVPQRAALAAFTVAAVVTLGLLAVRQRPFDGATPIPPTSIREVLRVLPVQPTP